MRKKLFSMLALLLTTVSGATAQTTYTVSVKEGTEDAMKWTAYPNPATAGQTVTMSYTGSKLVKSVKAKKKAKAAILSYYWYVGTDPITSSSVPGSGTVTNDETVIGWHPINGEPTEIQVGSTARLSANAIWYIAIPSYLGITKPTNGGLTDQSISSSLMTLADGIEYRVFITPAAKKVNYLMTK